MKKNLLAVCAVIVLVSLTACSTVNDGKSAMNDAENKAKSGIQQGMDAAENGVQKGINATENAAKDGINMAKDGVKGTSDAVKNGTDAVENAANAGMDAVENGVEQGADAAGRTAQGIHDGTQKVIDYAANALEGAGEYIDDSMNRDQGWVPYDDAADNAALDGMGGVVEAADGSSAANFEMISGFSTRLYDTEPARVANIKLAASKIDGMILQPTETFSFNNTVGERTTAAGFQEARALWMKEAIREVGGGVCQLSTTVYQAAKQAGLPIVERHPHQKPVNYVKEGMDACVDYGVFDLSFQNDSDRVLKVKASCDDVYVYVTIEREVK